MAAKKYRSRHRNKARTKRVELRLSEEEYDSIKERAAVFSTPMAEIIRRAALGMNVVVPLSLETKKEWREVRRLAIDLNDSLRLLHRIHNALDERVAKSSHAPSEWTPSLDEIGDRARDIEALLAQMLPLLSSMQATLRGEWREEIKRVQRGEPSISEDTSS